MSKAYDSLYYINLKDLSCLMLHSFFKPHAQYPDRVDATSHDDALAFDLKSFFDKPVMGWGVFHSRFDHADRHFEVCMRGEWRDYGGILYEDFVWNDGAKENRQWHLSYDEKDSKKFTAKAHDIIGTGYGQTHGNAMRMLYTMDVTRQNGQHIILDIDDRLYRVRDNVIMNKTIIKKFGFMVGNLTSTFVK